MRFFLVLVFFAGSTGYSQATAITYDVSHVSGNKWGYNYSVTNDSISNAIEEFSIYFDLNSYSNIQIISTPINWEPVLFQPDLGLPNDGIYDVLALSTGIGAGDSLSEFIVEFDYLLADTPGNQFFEIIDPITFSVLDSGSTSNVPLPNGIFLFLMGLVSLTFKNKKSSKV